MLEKRPQILKEHSINTDYFIYCLEGVQDTEKEIVTKAQKSLDDLTKRYGIASIYKTCDTIEGLEESLNTLLFEDHHFKDYEIIYLVMDGEPNSICLHDYYYSLQQIAELFEGALSGKILHFSNAKILDLDPEESQYFLDITGAKGISGYGNSYKGLDSFYLDNAFFNLYKNDNDIFFCVKELHKKHYDFCKLFDFRLYY